MQRIPKPYFLAKLPEGSMFEVKHPLPVTVYSHDEFYCAYLPFIDVIGYGNSIVQALHDLAFYVGEICKDAHSLVSRPVGHENELKFQRVKRLTEYKKCYQNPRKSMRMWPR